MNFKFSWIYLSWSTFGLIPFSECCLLKDLELHLSPLGVWTDFMGSSSDKLQTSPSPDSPHECINSSSTLFKESTHWIYNGSQEVSGDLGVKLQAVHGNVENKLDLCLAVPLCCCPCWGARELKSELLQLGCCHWCQSLDSTETHGLALFHSPAD